MSNAKLVTPESSEIAAGLAARIRGTGKTVSELTVGDLLTMLDDQRRLHHRIFEGGRHE